MVVESDATEIVKLINRESIDLTEVFVFIDEIRELASQANVAMFCFSPRSSNFLAHSLARAVGKNDYFSFFCFGPSPVSRMDGVVRVEFFWPPGFPQFWSIWLYLTICLLNDIPFLKKKMSNKIVSSSVS